MCCDADPVISDMCPAPERVFPRATLDKVNLFDPKAFASVSEYKAPSFCIP